MVTQKVTVEQVISGFRSLNDEDQQRVWRTIYNHKRASRFLSLPNQPWHLTSLFGPEAVSEALRLKGKQAVDDSLVRYLFRTRPIHFFTNATGTHLFAGENAAFELDFGPLTYLAPLHALQQYGLAKLEAAKEKGYIRL